MTKASEVENAYKVAQARYAEIGVDTEAMLAKLAKIKLSVHCWQGDDIHGFVNSEQELTGALGFLAIIPAWPGPRIN